MFYSLSASYFIVVTSWGVILKSSSSGWCLQSLPPTTDLTLNNRTCGKYKACHFFAYFNSQQILARQKGVPISYNFYNFNFQKNFQIPELSENQIQLKQSIIQSGDALIAPIPVPYYSVPWV